MRRTLCLERSSFERAEDMILRRIEEGAAKCALRDLRLEEETSVTHNTKENIRSSAFRSTSKPAHQSFPCLIHTATDPSSLFRPSNRTDSPTEHKDSATNPG